MHHVDWTRYPWIQPTIHRVDCARPIGYGLTAQIQVSTGTIAHAVFRASGHERIQREVKSAPPAEHDPIAHE